MKNVFTVDLEEYFQVSAFEPFIPKADWGKHESRLDWQTNRLLEMFDEHDAKATFFILGWIAEKHPELVKKIAGLGHEIASHGYWHRRASDQTQSEFLEDVKSARGMLQDLTGCSVEGYRAPSFSFNGKNNWVYDVLAEVGHTYSSSVYPVKHDHYGIPDAPRFSYMTESGVLEIPLSTLKLGNKNVPISGGGYFRLYPYAVTEWMLKRFKRADNQPYIFYMHPWEIDAEQPKQQGLSFKSRFRHYLNLSKVQSRIDTLLADSEWACMNAVYGQQ